MDRKAIDRALRTVHPLLMSNLKLDAGGRIVVVDRRFYWERRLGWGKKAEVLRRERERQEQHDRAWRASMRNARRLGREREKLRLRRRRRRATAS